MQYPALAALIFLSVSSSAMGAPTTQPMAPIEQIPVPAARVAQTPPSRIVILPFDNLGDPMHRDWVGRAIQESLGTEIARMGGLFPISAAGASPADTVAAQAAGKSFSGDTVIFGSYQFADDGDIRITAQIIRVNSGQAMGGLKASGSFRDLFDLEDRLAAQAGRALRPPAQSVLASWRTGRGDDMIFDYDRTYDRMSAEDIVGRPLTDQERLADAYQRYYYSPDPASDLDDAGYESPADDGYYFGDYGYLPFNSLIVVFNGRGRHLRSGAGFQGGRGPIINRNPGRSPGRVSPFGGGMGMHHGR